MSLPNPENESATFLPASSASADVATALWEPAPTEVLDINGWKVLLRPTTHNEIVSLGCFLPRGAAGDPLEKAGRSSLAMNLLEKGAGERDAKAMAEAIEDLGSVVTASVTHDYSKIGCSASSRAFDATLDILEDIIHRPRFEADEVERERALQIAALQASDDNQSAYTGRHFLKALFPESIYGIPSDGRPETVENLTRDDLAEVHTANWGSASNVDRGLVAAVGNFDRESLASRLEALLPIGTAAKRNEAEPETSSAESELEMTLTKEVEQAFLCYGWRTVPMGHEDYPALRLLAAILGEGMGSRLFIKLRDELGLAYSVGCASRGRRDESYLMMYIGTKPERLEESVRGFERITDEVCQAAPTVAEIERARNYASGRFLSSHQKNSRQVHFLGYFEMMGLGWQTDSDWPGRLMAVTPDDLQRVAQKYMSSAPTQVRLLPD